ncbi:hypothetical protein C8R46DRAFT_1358162, partial [Mycena filopes]
MAGTNDILDDISTGAAALLSSLIDIIFAACPDAAVLVTTRHSLLTPTSTFHASVNWAACCWRISGGRTQDTPNLEVVTFRLSGDWEGQRHESVQTAADEALFNHPTLSAAHFIVCSGFVSGGLAGTVAMQLPRCHSAGLLVFSGGMSDVGRAWNLFTKYFGEPVLDEVESLFEVTPAEVGQYAEEYGGEYDGEGSDDGAYY